MATTKVHSGLISVSGSFRETLLGDGMSNGPTMTFSNGITLKDYNIDGWLNGEGTVVGGTNGYINWMQESDPFNSMGDASFQPGFIPSISGKYLVGVYFEMLENDSGDGYGRGSVAKPSNSLKFEIFAEQPYVITCKLSVVGDCYLYVNQNLFAELNSSMTVVRVSLLDENDNAANSVESATFRACFFMRTNAYAVK